MAGSCQLHCRNSAFSDSKFSIFFLLKKQDSASYPPRIQLFLIQKFQLFFLLKKTGTCHLPSKNTAFSDSTLKLFLMQKKYEPPSYPPIIQPFQIQNFQVCFCCKKTGSCQLPCRNPVFLGGFMDIHNFQIFLQVKNQDPSCINLLHWVQR